MIVIYDPVTNAFTPVRFTRDAAGAASVTSSALCHPVFGSGAQVWLVPELPEGFERQD